MGKFKGEYPHDWKQQAITLKDAADWRCVRCGHVLTIHHADGDKSNSAWWNLLPLCQRCHLSIQAKVTMDRPWIYAHSEWFKPYVGGFYAKKYLGLDLSREQVMEDLEYYASLEANRLMG